MSPPCFARFVFSYAQVKKFIPEPPQRVDALTEVVEEKKEPLLSRTILFFIVQFTFTPIF